MVLPSTGATVDKKVLRSCLLKLNMLLLAAQETVYLRPLLAGFRFPHQRGPTEVWEDDAACISISEDSGKSAAHFHTHAGMHQFSKRLDGQSEIADSKRKHVLA